MIAKITRLSVFTLAVAMSTAIAGASTSEVRETARKLHGSQKDAVVWVSVLTKISVSADGDAAPQIKAALAAQEKDEKSETIGTIIDPSGLVVTALGGIDKATLINGQTLNTAMGAVKLNANSEIKEVKVLTADGVEIPADLVMKDENLGVAFLKVRSESDEAKGVKFQAVDLANSAEGKLLDECIVLGRLDESFNRETSLATSEISGVILRPRTLYNVATEAVGCPIYLANGKLLGVSVMRKPKLGAGLEQLAQLKPVIVPAADIAKIAAQAKDAKPAKESSTE